MPSLLLFVLGAAFGSFVYLIALRYEPEAFLLSRRVILGRSECPHCRKKLRWYELIPILSFGLQAGRCRSCKAKLSWNYPLTEIISGLIFVLVPLGAGNYFSVAPAGFLPPAAEYLVYALWLAVFLALLLMALIDLRLRMIPDEVILFLLALGVAFSLLAAPYFRETAVSFVGAYAPLFGLRGGGWWNHLSAAAIAAAFFGLLFAATRGRGMGMGDVKLALALGFVFGWPASGLITILGFILGSIWGGAAILRGRETLKGLLPFGPFLAAASAVVFFFGYRIVDFYFRLFNL